MVYNNIENKIVCCIIIIFVTIGCQPKNSINPTSFSEIIIGNWAYVGSDSSYNEVYFDNNKILFQPEGEAHTGPYNYSILNNILDFNDITYRVEMIDCKTIKLVSAKYNLILDKIPLNKPMFSTELENGFWLRRCFYLANKDIISLDEAYYSLKNYDIDEYENVEDEFIPINR